VKKRLRTTGLEKIFRIKVKLVSGKISIKGMWRNDDKLVKIILRMLDDFFRFSHFLILLEQGLQILLSKTYSPLTSQISDCWL